MLPVLSINRIVSVRCGGDFSVLPGAGRASVGVLSLVWGIAFQEECGSAGDGWKAARNIRGLKNVRNNCSN